MSSIIGDRPLLVGGGDSLCKFQMMDGTYEESDVSFKIFYLTYQRICIFFLFVKGQNCLSDWENPDDAEHDTVHYVCKKNSACGMYTS